MKVVLLKSLTFAFLYELRSCYLRIGKYHICTTIFIVYKITRCMRKLKKKIANSVNITGALSKVIKSHVLVPDICIHIYYLNITLLLTVIQVLEHFRETLQFGCYECSRPCIRWNRSLPLRLSKRPFFLGYLFCCHSQKIKIFINLLGVEINNTCFLYGVYDIHDYLYQSSY